MRTLIAGAAITCLATPAIAQDIELGNGERNHIKIEGIERSQDAPYFEVRTASNRQHLRRGDGVTLTIPEVKIDGDGWLVMHPFIDGKPSGTYIAGYSFVESGINRDVGITLNPAPASGDKYIIMLHKDVDEDRVFDFVFVGENVVEDKAVFEGTRMIAQVVTIP